MILLIALGLLLDPQMLNQPERLFWGSPRQGDCENSPVEKKGHSEIRVTARLKTKTYSQRHLYTLALHGSMHTATWFMWMEFSNTFQHPFVLNRASFPTESNFDDTLEHNMVFLEHNQRQVAVWMLLGEQGAIFATKVAQQGELHIENNDVILPLNGESGVTVCTLSGPPHLDGQELNMTESYGVVQDPRGYTSFETFSAVGPRVLDFSIHECWKYLLDTSPSRVAPICQLNACQ